MIARAPFPYFGGKSRAAALVWQRFGKPVNYVEPFAGSLAVLLACPEEQRPRVETVNDCNALLCNFWRATRADPEAVASVADYPVIETDLHARHRWLLARAAGLREKLDADPDYFDAKIAGWWVWGASASIAGWCEESAPKDHWRQLPNLAAKGAGGEPSAGFGTGIHAAGMRAPSLTSQAAPSPNLRHGTHSPERRTRLYDIFAALAARLRYTRVACGDFARILTPSVTYRHGLTAVFLDPPYDGYEHVYGAAGKGEPISARVRAWCLDNGHRPDMRIALCGYEGEHDLPGWEVVPWKAKGGYANQGAGDNENKHRERIWFSPRCLGGSGIVVPAPLPAPPDATDRQLDLFAGRTP